MRTRPSVAFLLRAMELIPTSKWGGDIAGLFEQLQPRRLRGYCMKYLKIKCFLSGGVRGV